MNPHKNSEPIQTTLTAYFVKSRGRRERLVFLPKCSQCGKTILDPSEANCAVVDGDGSLGRPERVGDATFCEIGPANVYCWPCDAKVNHVPWSNALGTFRALDEPQRFPEVKR